MKNIPREKYGKKQTLKSLKEYIFCALNAIMFGKIGVHVHHIL